MGVKMRRGPVSRPAVEVTVSERFPNTVPLAELKVGQSGIVRHVGGGCPHEDPSRGENPHAANLPDKEAENTGLARRALRRRLLDMGLTPGVRVELYKTAPMGDPMELRLRGYNLSLRREDAMDILVHVLPEHDEGLPVSGVRKAEEGR